MQSHHRQGLGFVFSGQFLKEKHSCIVDKNVDWQVLRLAESKQFICSRFRRQILKMRNNLNVSALLQRLSGFPKLCFLITDQQQVTTNFCQLAGILQSHARATAGN